MRISEFGGEGRGAGGGRLMPAGKLKCYKLSPLKKDGSILGRTSLSSKLRSESANSELDLPFCSVLVILLRVNLNLQN